ncbi:MAG: rhomboid family intramembrane serine protease [Planctomycetota bacterium]|jgi:membrane associated rhomboid family serine protease
MFPLKTTVRVNSWPVVTWLLIALNMYFFVVQHQVTDAEMTSFYGRYALTPGHFIGLFEGTKSITDYSPIDFLPFLSCMFLHGGIWHLLGNMLSLWVFGPNIEDRLGHVGFTVFYLACGLAASITQVPFTLDSTVQVLGASGAIAGVMGAFFVLFATARVVSIVPIWIVPLIVRIPAFFFLLFWIGMNIINGLTAVQLATHGKEDAAGVAWWAHIGGFVIGMILAVFLKKNPPEPSEVS